MPLFQSEKMRMFSDRCVNVLIRFKEGKIYVGLFLHHSGVELVDMAKLDMRVEGYAGIGITWHSQVEHQLFFVRGALVFFVA